MNQSVSIALKSLVLIFLIHLLINNFQKKSKKSNSNIFSKLFSFFKKPSENSENIEIYQIKINDLEKKINHLKKNIMEPVKTTIKEESFTGYREDINPKPKQVKKIENELNIENIKNDLEDYLDNKTQHEKSSHNEIYHNSDFDSDAKMDFESNFDTSKYEKPVEMEVEAKDDDIKQNKQSKNEADSKEEIAHENDKCLRNNNLNYEEWVYKNENKMNGVELFDGIFAYDNMVGNYCSF